MTLPHAFRHFVRYASPRILMVASVVALSIRAWLGEVGLADLWIILGIMVAWPFIEWLIHVYVLHLKPITVFGRTFDLPVANKHRRHHGDPWNLEILFIPLYSLILSLPAHVLGWNLVFEPPQAFTAIAFFFVMTLHYEWVHFLVHTPYNPKSSVYRRLRKNHRLHHCKNEKYWMGVTMLTADKVFATAPDAQAVDTSQTCRTLL